MAGRKEATAPVAHVEQIKARRAGIGLRALDPDAASPGFTLFTPMTAERTAYLIDLAGNPVHTWALPHPPGLYGYLTPEGTLLYNGRTPETSARLIANAPWKGGAVLEMDWSGRVLHEVRHPDHHHDARRLRNGNLLLLCLAPLPPDVASRVRGGAPGTEHKGVMYADYLVEMTRDGRAVWEWRAWEHLDPEADPIVYAGQSRAEWTHGNAVAELADGTIAVSFRNICTVAIIDKPTSAITWKLTAPTLAQQHAPRELPSGNLLIFDNGSHRFHSRVIEVDRATKEVVWSYQEPRPMDFFSPLISNAEPLPNGNVLICEGSFGRLFEVTRAGCVVWEYVNPHFGPPANQPDGPPQNNVFRAFRYDPATIARAREAM